MYVWLSRKANKLLDEVESLNLADFRGNTQTKGKDPKPGKILPRGSEISIFKNVNSYMTAQKS
jgi:hypothetical protein